MARIGIITCSNCTQETNCASTVCLADMRKRQGLFSRYPADEPLDLVGIISCAGCPTLAAPEKILKRVRAVADYRIDALHLAFCMTAVCPFITKYTQVIHAEYPGIEIVLGTHKPIDTKQFQAVVKELLHPTVCPPQTMNDAIKRTIKLPAQQEE
ncbi:MAG: CGGC domain-containing protein [Deltaproteobacteria bacterium]|nr:CGGC domain-containing protein [Deltaproteobacteria bacterium]